jgi:hypothetical protein
VGTAEDDKRMASVTVSTNEGQTLALVNFVEKN